MAAALMAVSYFADGGGSSYHVHKQDSGQIRPEHFLVHHGSRVLAHRKGRTSGMLRPDSARIQPEQEPCPGFWHPKNWNESWNVPPSGSSWWGCLCDVCFAGKKSSEREFFVFAGTH